MNLVVENYNSLVRKFHKMERACSEQEIHDKRVILRKTYPILDAYKIKPARVKNGDKAFKLFGKLRNIQVQILKLKMMEQTPEIVEYLNYLKFKELDINGDVRVFCRQKKVEFPHIKSKSTIDTSRLIKKAEKYVNRINKEIQSENINNAKDIHRIRINFKKFRYLMEILSNLTYVDPKMLENIHYYQDKLGEIQDYRILIADYSSFCKKNMLKRTKSIELFQEKQNTLIEEFKQNLNAFITVCIDAISFRIILATQNDEVTEPDKINDLKPK